MPSDRLETCNMQCPKIGFLPRPMFLLKIKKGNHGPRNNGWTMIPDRTLEEKSYVSLARNHGYQFIMFRKGKGIL